MSLPLEALGTAVPRALIVAVAAFLLAEAWRRLALRRGVLDVPGHRSSHVVATPRGAGIGIAAATGLGIALWAPPGDGRTAVLLGGATVALVGLIDDFRPLRASTKFVGQAVAAWLVAVAFPMSPESLPFAVPQPLGVAASAAIVLLFVNAWNFMDGIDGIATLAAMAVCGSVLAVSLGTGDPLLLSLAWGLFAACLGFLPLNFPKARAFMGDCGSHAVGFGLALLVLAAPHRDAAWVALAASAAFLVDVLGTLVLRAREGERLASAHRRHLYQLVTRSGYSHVRVTTAYAAWMLGSGGMMAMAQAVGYGAAGLVSIFLATSVTWCLLGRHFTMRLKERDLW